MAGEVKRVSTDVTGNLVDTVNDNLGLRGADRLAAEKILELAGELLCSVSFNIRDNRNISIRALKEFVDKRVLRTQTASA